MKRSLSMGAAFLMMAAGLARAQGLPEWQRVQVANNAGDVKLAADIDNDSYPDLVLGGMPGEGLNWYRYPSWTRTLIAQPSVEFTTSGAMGDIDADGDQDIIVPDGNSGNNLKWFRNPRKGAGGAQGNPLNPAEWQRFDIGATGGWGKDVYAADFDGDQKLDVAVRAPGQVMIFFQNVGGSWQRVNIVVPGGSEGMGMGDIDADLDQDLVIRGAWTRNPGGAAARTPASWTVHQIGAAPDEFKAAVGDVDGNAKADVVFTSSEGTADVTWWSPGAAGPTGAWQPHVAMAGLNRAHSLAVADINRDGRRDLFVAQMHSGEGRIMVLYNVNGLGTQWQTQVVDTGGTHNAVLVDIGRDGDTDIYGANFTGHPPAVVWENQSGCYADCNGDGAANLADFGCFQTRFAGQDPYADCNGDGAMNLADFGCFQTRFAAGCG